MSTSFHPQTDGQTENSNKILETILRSVVNFEQTDWDIKLTAAELAVNNSKNVSTGYTPFYLSTGREIRMPLDAAIEPLHGANTNEAAAQDLQRWEEAISHARGAMEGAKRSQAKYANLSRREVTFKVGDRVLVSNRNVAIIGESRRTKKLTARFFGPYPIIRVINKNAYELTLPPEMRIHPVINVSQLKPYRDGSGDFPFRPVVVDRPGPESADAHGQEEYQVERITDKRVNSRRTEYLVLWKGYPPEEATWEPKSELTQAREAIAAYETIQQEAPRELRRSPAGAGLF
jgi:hypothetical protein